MQVLLAIRPNVGMKYMMNEAVWKVTQVTTTTSPFYQLALGNRAGLNKLEPRPLYLVVLRELKFYEGINDHGDTMAYADQDTLGTMQGAMPGLIWREIGEEYFREVTGGNQNR